MENLKRYNRLTEYLKEKFGERVLKICIDGGFTCPNRDGTTGFGGCIFCSETGSGDHMIHNKDISNQIKNYFLSYKSSRANKFIAYFQNFTNTYDSIENLKRKYDSALIDDRIVALAIATRPDCINEDIVKLLHSYTSKYYVWVELGLQTSNDETGRLINRGYSSKQFTKAVALLNKYNIDVVTHIMVGLPGESESDLKNTVSFINSHNIQGIKIHSTYVIKNTILAQMYYNELYKPLTLDEYLNSVVYILTHIPKNIIIHRISGDAPKNLLIAPDWNSHKKLILNGVDKIMKENNLWQGCHISNF
ncbi:MAG: TIGR01212 family radical SAM protein [Clostridia bacterium]|nr:TIGR01212 family radical SAM protein [Clostridia bacterium]